MECEFGTLEFYVKYDGTDMYIVDLPSTPLMDADSFIHSLLKDVRHEYDRETQHLFNAWLIAMYQIQFYYENPWYTLMQFTDIPLLDDDMYVKEDNVFEIRPEELENIVLSMWIAEVYVTAYITGLAHDMETYLENWFENYDVEFPGMDPDALRTAFREAAEEEIAEEYGEQYLDFFDALIVHRVVFEEDSTELYFELDIFGFEVETTVTFYDYDETVLDEEDDTIISVQELLDEFAIRFELAAETYVISTAADMYCGQHGCATGDILTETELAMLIDQITMPIPMISVDGDYLVEVSEDNAYRVAYEVDVDGVTYRFCGMIETVFEYTDDYQAGLDLFTWFVREGDPGFDLYAIDFVNRILPEDTIPAEDVQD